MEALLEPPALTHSKPSDLSDILPLDLQILVVDDNRDAADSTAIMLRLFGAEVSTCYDAESAILTAEWFGPDVAILDINMPGMDGNELATRLRQWTGGYPLLLIALTAMSDEDSRLRIERAGFDYHLVKPVDPRRLVELLSNHLRGLRR